eukprot:s379_g2.t3
MAVRTLVVLAGVCYALHDCDGACRPLVDPSLSDETGFVQAKLSATSSEEELRRPHRYRRGPHSADGYYGDKTEANSTVKPRRHRWSRWYTPTWWDDLPKKPRPTPPTNIQRGHFIHYAWSLTPPYARGRWGECVRGAEATLHYVSACGQCGSEVDLCSSNIWWQNEPDMEDQEDFRAGSDLATWGCANVGSSPTIVRNSITGAIYVVEWAVEDPWQIVFRQTTPFVFEKTPLQWTLNEADPTASNFSILGDLENFRVGGAFYFKLCWPVENYTCQVWTQTSNPVTTTDGSVNGYAAIDVPYTEQFWGGLHYNGNNALLDGSSVSNSNNWWYSIGAFSIYSGGMPGPGDQIATQVELWVSTVELEIPTPDPVPNPGDSSADNFAILDTLDSYKVSGVFYFMMRWRKLENQSEPLPDQIWAQSSNPVTTTDGSAAIDVPYTGQFWGGLHYNGNNALLDGSSVSNSNNWWYSIGTFNEYNGGFPGPDGMIASQVELWVSNQALAIPVSVVPSLPAPAANWQLLFRQTNGFWFTPGQWSVNPGDSSADNFAILDTLDSYKVSGVFYFMMRWIKEDDGTQLQDQIWSQTSNPVTTTDGSVTGYAPIEVNYPNPLWGGLHYSSGNNALLDGASVGNSNNWWYSIGAHYEYNGGFPGPTGIIVSRVELWVSNTVVTP